nr:YitT family protein [Peptoniphilus catoniae]
MLDSILSRFSLKRDSFFRILLGCSIMSFTVVNIHLQAGITEGGVLGLTVLLYKLLDFDPSIASGALDFICFLLAFSRFGKNFLKKTAVASLAFAVFYKIFMGIGAFLPSFYNMPIIASVLGGIGIGIGCGLVIEQGGAAGGDDALALVIADKLKVHISKAYLISDLVVLFMSLAYIPFNRIFFSIITTVVSSILVGQFEVNLEGKKQEQSA